ncbi:hypothetical protein BDW02DRAFT_430395 [Decorospora gaudefroyi]|uniref:Uncharacterized protein n=1 Tax=Decorospora gaudefroyi TaxID=184978 RepID=A0A6A5K8E4_9PLEO|nr:hypothetical protein BDW02DRAFT_430395 [Decorospora gaudefroyi]
MTQGKHVRCKTAVSTLVKRLRYISCKGRVNTQTKPPSHAGPDAMQCSYRRCYERFSLTLYNATCCRWSVCYVSACAVVMAVLPSIREGARM